MGRKHIRKEANGPNTKETGGGSVGSSGLEKEDYRYVRAGQNNQ